MASWARRRGAAAGAAADSPVWLVDPNDGTRDYLKGRRGSAVSIALLVRGLPRLGVVYAFAYPDDARGPLRVGRGLRARAAKRTAAVDPRCQPRSGAGDVVLLSSAGDDDPERNLASVAPARLRTLPSIAHRLALVAAGEAAAAVSLHGPGAWDYGAGHALLRGAGAALVDEAGAEVRYGEDGRSKCRFAFGAHPRASPGRWRPATGRGARGHGTPATAVPARLALGAVVADAGRLRRAQGCLLGQLAGDNLGALVEFQTADEIAAQHPDGPAALVDGGRWSTLAGQPTDDSEMALALARAILERERFDAAATREAYAAWLAHGALRRRRHRQTPRCAGSRTQSARRTGR